MSPPPRDRAQRVGVGGGSHGLIARFLLRAPVKRSAHAEVGFGEPGTARDTESQRDAEVRHHGLTVLQEYVAWLDVTVDDTVFMGVLERTATFEARATAS